MYPILLCLNTFGVSTTVAVEQQYLYLCLSEPLTAVSEYVLARMLAIKVI